MTTHEETYRQINKVRAEALEHTRLARELFRERQDLMRGLMEQGVSQADIAREMGVSRQAVQKMLAL
jgi:DNA-binding transcriptional regulator LsrR (DeoR family)